MMGALASANARGADAVSDGGSTAHVNRFAAAQRAAIAAPRPASGGGAALPRSQAMFGGLVMAKIRMKSKRLKIGMPRRDVDGNGKEMNRILKLNEVIGLCGKSDDKMWKKKINMRKRYAMIQNEYRKATVGLADDVRFLVRCFELLDEDEAEELTTEQLLRWVTLLGDPSGDGQGGDGDGAIRKDLLAKLEKHGESSARFDWQDFVVVNIDFYVLAGSAAMRRTYGELLESEGGKVEDELETESLPLEPTPPSQPKKASLADDVRERRAARAAKLGIQLGVKETPPAGNAAPAGVGPRAGGEATVGSGGGRQGPSGDIESPGDDEEVVFEGSEDTVNLDEPDKEEMRLAEAVVPE